MATLKQLKEGKTARAVALSALVAAGGTFAALDKDTRPVDASRKHYSIPHNKPVLKPKGKVTINGKEHYVYFPGNVAFPVDK